MCTMSDSTGEVNDPYMSEYSSGFDDILHRSEDSPQVQLDDEEEHQQAGGPPTVPKGGRLPAASPKYGSHPPTEPKCGRLPAAPPKYGRNSGPRQRSPEAISKHGGYPIPQQRVPMVKAAAKAVPRAPKRPRSRVPWELKDWGTPGYDPIDRSLFCTEYRRDPDGLRRKIVKTIKEHPGYTTKQFNRLLFDTYGARMRELALLFGCSGSRQLLDGVFCHSEACEELKELLKTIDFGRPSRRYQIVVTVARVVPSG